MKKCPKCDINYINDEEELCSICSNHNSSRREYCYSMGDTHIIDEELTIRIKSRMSVVRAKCGYDVFDLSDNVLGVVFESDVPRTARHKMAEIAFLPSLENKYGDWRVIKINGGYLPFEHLKQILACKNEYICTTDRRSRRPH